MVDGNFVWVETEIMGVRRVCMGIGQVLIDLIRSSMWVIPWRERQSSAGSERANGISSSNICTY